MSHSFSTAKAGCHPRQSAFRGGPASPYDEAANRIFQIIESISPLPMTFFDFAVCRQSRLCTVIDTPMVCKRRFFASSYANTNTMSRSISSKEEGWTPRYRSRPHGRLRLSQEARAAVKKWAASQRDKPNFSEAVRRLIDIGLKSLDELSGAKWLQS